MGKEAAVVVGSVETVEPAGTGRDASSDGVDALDVVLAMVLCSVSVILMAVEIAGLTAVE